MYRIKTDIRQYKCDTKEKVEKLIRNWVIRPNDLIYQADQQRWSPIGEHPSFLDLFATLEAQERAEPETVVTSNPLVEADVVSVPIATSDLAEPHDGDEVTRIQARPVAADEGNPDAPEPSEETIVGSIEGVAGTPSFDQVSDESAENFRAPIDTVSDPDPADLPSDIRQTEAIDLPLALPAAPAGIEPLVRADEVTVMTERTFDLLKVTSEASSAPVSDTPPEEILSHDETIDLGSASSAAEEMAAATDTVNPLEHSKPKLGRHDLPEDFFATNELMAPVDRDSLRNDLAALEKAAKTTAPAEETWEGEPVVQPGLEDTSLPDDEEDDIAEPADELEDEYAPGDEERDEWDEYDDLDAEEISSHLIEKHSDRVADVYNIPLPFEIVPDEEDLTVGIKRNNTHRSVKDRAFPYPVEKEFKKAHTKTFDFSKQPPTDRSPLLVLGILGAVVLIVVVIAMS